SYRCQMGEEKGLRRSCDTPPNRNGARRDGPARLGCRLHVVRDSALFKRQRREPLRTAGRFHLWTQRANCGRGGGDCDAVSFAQSTARLPRPGTLDTDATKTGDERLFVKLGEVTLFSESIGDRNSPAVLFIMGAIPSGVWWPASFCTEIVARG